MFILGLLTFHSRPSSLYRNLETLKPWNFETLLLSPKRHAKMLQQRPRLIIIRRRSHNGDVHALLLVNLLVGNLRKDQLVVQPDRVIPPPVKRLGGDSLE